MISIIVPVYNAEKYLHRCVKSILSLKFCDYELILVDDGSIDHSPVVCDEYAKKDKRIHVIHQDNQGQAAARNAGLDVARGEWILFCDADDQYDSAMLDQFLRFALPNTDIRLLHCFDFRNVWPTNIETKGRYCNTEIITLSVQDTIDYISSEAAHTMSGYSLWNKLYSRKLIEQYHIRMPEKGGLGNKDDWAEDLIFNLQYFLCIDRIRVSDKPAYFLTKHGFPHEQNESSLVGRLNHMLKFFAMIQNTPVFKQSSAISDNYWKIVIWHMRRYLYLEAGNNGVGILRHQYISSPYHEQLFGWINAALANWEQIEDRWDQTNGIDYRLLLRYLRDGNILAYKAGNYWIWKIKPRIQSLIRRKS